MMDLQVDLKLDYKANLERYPLYQQNSRSVTLRVGVCAVISRHRVIPSICCSSLAVVGLMLMHGLRSAEVMALNRDDVLFSEGQLRVRGKGSKMRFLPLAPDTTQLIDHYLRLERTDPCSAALFVVLKGPARSTRMTPAGMRSLFRYIAAPPALSWPTHIASDTHLPPIWCVPASACPH